MISYVYEFNRKMGLPLGDKDLLMGDGEGITFRLNFLDEELCELFDAIQAGDRVKAFAALLDLVYVAQGTALYMGITPAQWDAGMRAVHDANMVKVRAADGIATKIISKPEGWVGPEARLKQILAWDQSDKQLELGI